MMFLLMIKIILTFPKTLPYAHCVSFQGDIFSGSYSLLNPQRQKSLKFSIYRLDRWTSAFKSIMDVILGFGIFKGESS